MIRDPGCGAQKLACLIQYFEASRRLEGTEDDQRFVIVERRCFEGSAEEMIKVALASGDAAAAAAGESPRPLALLHAEGMETQQCDAFVNFANRRMG